MLRQIVLGSVVSFFLLAPKALFAAGKIDMQTLQFSNRRNLNDLSLTMGSNPVSTGEDFVSAGDGLSFSGAGGQPIPTSLPAFSRSSVNRGVVTPVCGELRPNPESTCKSGPRP